MKLSCPATATMLLSGENLMSETASAIVFFDSLSVRRRKKGPPPALLSMLLLCADCTDGSRSSVSKSRHSHAPLLYPTATSKPLYDTAVTRVKTNTLSWARASSQHDCICNHFEAHYDYNNISKLETIL